MTRTTLLALLAVACSDSKPKAPYEPLLGRRSDTSIRRFEASCDERFATVNPIAKDEPKPFARIKVERDIGDSEKFECEMSNLTNYGVAFVFGQVMTVWIEAPAEADRLVIFDRVFAGIMPEDVREQMRNSISDPTHFEVAATKAHVELHVMENSIDWTVTLGGKR